MKFTPSGTIRSLWLFLFTFFALQLQASHIVGGEISYQCLGNGWYKVVLTQYRDCSGVILPASTNLTIRKGNGALIGAYTIPKGPSTFLNVNQPGCGAPTPNICVETADYALDSVYLPGNPQGYHIYNQGCCRNNGVNNITNAWKVGSTIHSRIIGNSVACNNSPKFKTYPPVVLPVNVPLSVNASASDPDADSLSYELCTPFDDDNTSPPFVSVPLAPGYSSSYLVPSSPLFSIDPVTGMITGKVTTVGKYAVGICVFEYRNGALIGTIRRDYQFTVVQPWSVFASIGASADASCPSANDGSATAAVGGGTAPYSFLWSNSATTQTVTNLAPGKYTVTVSDNSGCHDTASVVIEASPAFTAVISTQSDAGCGGSGGGSATISVTDGQPPYTITWPDASTGLTHTNLPAGTHAVAVSDQGGCTDTVFVTINSAPSTLAANGVVTDEFCPGSLSGKIDVTVTSGSGPFTFVWNDGPVTEDRIGLAAGNYHVAVSDKNGCTDTLYFTVSAGVALTAAFDSIKNLHCAGQADGFLSAAAANANGPLQYHWNTGAVTPAISALSPGPYWVVVTDSVGCQDSLYTSLTAPDTLKINLVQLTQVKCFGQNDGGIDIGVSGGTAPYTIAWSNAQTGTSISNLAPGSYKVDVTDAAGCTTSGTFVINAPGQISVNLRNIEHESCVGEDGKIAVGITGGVKPYQLSWNNGQSDSTALNLTAGTYSLLVTDAKGCTDTTFYTINATLPPVASIDSLSPASCGLNNGAASLYISSGKPPYTVSWSNGQAGLMASNLPSGSLSAIIIDSAGCRDTIDVMIPNSGGLSITMDSIAGPACVGQNNGFAQVTTFGGQAPLTFKWSSGDSLSSTSRLSSGMGYVVVSDAQGCSDSLSFNVPVASAISINTDTLQNVSCAGAANGKVKITMAGGSPPYRYTWSNGDTLSEITSLSGGQYSVTVTDNRGCSVNGSYTISEPDSLLISLKNQVQPGCGAADGSIAIGVKGGSAPYTILWSDSQSDSTAVNLGAGTYSVMVTDSSGCSRSANYILQAPAAITLALDTVLNASCGMANAEATLVVNGGSGSYAVSWSNGGNGLQQTGLAAGTYTAVVTDSLGCVDSLIVAIGNSGNLSATLDTVTSPACPGHSNGFASVSVSGGTAPYQYYWNSTDTLSATNSLAAGNAYVVVTDSRGCRDSLPFVVPAADSLVVALDSLEHVSCHGAANGKIKISVSGGTPPYTLNWTNGDTISTLNRLGGGSYGVTVTDSRACSTSASFTLTEPDSIQISLKSVAHVSCAGGASGEVAIGIKGGHKPYIISWGNGQMDSTATGLFAGTQVVTVTDSSGCSASDSFVVTEPAMLSLTLDSVTTASCGLNNGTAAVSASGGTPPYSYRWSNGGISDTVNSLGSGNYTVVVTDSAGCKDSLLVAVPNAGNLSINLDSLKNVACSGANDGYISVSASGGSAPYTFSWSSGDSTNTMDSLAAGSYTVTLYDNSGCQVSGTFQVLQLDSIKVTLKSLVNASCGSASGKIEIGIAGGAPPYAILWSNGQSDSSAVNLGGGTYTATVTDANGCRVSPSYTIFEPSGVTLQTDTILSATCGGSNGSATLAIGGGTAPFAISWSNGQSGLTATNLSAGSLSAHVVDSNGCADTIYLSIPNAGGMSVTLDSLLGPACGGQNTGFGKIVSTGGAAPLSVRWSNGDSLTATSTLPTGPGFVVVTDALGCYDSLAFNVPATDSLEITLDSLQQVTCHGAANGKIKINISGGTPPYALNWTNGDTISTLNKLGGGSYGVTVTDSRACSTSASFTLTEPDSLQLTLKSLHHVSCNGLNDGEIAVHVSGGAAPYTFVWSKGPTDSTASYLFAGNHLVYVTDANGCMLVDSFAIDQPDSLSFTVDSLLPASCGKLNGYVKLSGKGGTPPYTFEWNNGPLTPEVDSLGTGIYTVKITDSSGCEFTNHVSLPSTSPFSAYVAGISSPSCIGMSDGSAAVGMNGGTPPYSYHWIGGDTTSSVQNLGSGPAYVLVQDGRGCSDSLPFMVPAADSLVISLDSLSPVSCYGDADGFIQVSVSGGTAPYTYAWSNTAVSAHVSALAAGIHSLTVTDGKGCSASASYIVSQPDSLSISLKTIRHVGCAGGADGELAISVKGGTGPYSIIWNTNQTDSTISGLSAGMHSTTVTDANGCSLAKNYSISEASPISISLDSTMQAGCGLPNGGALISVTGGSGVYTIGWDNGETGVAADSLLAGSHMVWVADSLGCRDSLQLTVPAAPPLMAGIDSLRGPLCAGGNDGYAELGISGGVPPYSISWSNAATQNVNGSLGSGPGFVVVSDSKGCRDSLGFIVPFTDSITVNVDSIRHVLCYGEPSAFIEVSVQGGAEPYTINWGNNTFGKVLQNGIAGTYTVSVTDSNGCTANRNFTITQPDSFFVIVDSVKSPSCIGQNDGAVYMRASGNHTIAVIQANLGKVNPNNVSELGAGKYSFWVENGNGCGTLVEFEIKKPEPIKIEAYSNYAPTCENEPNGSIELNISGGNGGPYSYQWGDGSLSGNRYDLTAGRHTVTVTDRKGCSSKKDFYVAPKQMAMYFSLGDVGCFENADARLEVEVSGATLPYTLWLNDQQVYHDQKVQAGRYQLTVIDADSCSVSKTLIVEPSKASELFFANAFTPNRDGLNDTYELKATPECFSNARLEIFNRWGGRIFATDRPFEVFWDGMVNGEPAKSDIYMYSFSSDERQAQGYLNVLK